MCRDVQNACSALMRHTGDGAAYWADGIEELGTQRTLATILHTCREVGRQCIIQTCRGASGNFALCDNIEHSSVRHSILRRSVCWGDVVNCVAAAGPEQLREIFAQQGWNHYFQSVQPGWYDVIYGPQPQGRQWQFRNAAPSTSIIGCAGTREENLPNAALSTHYQPGHRPTRSPCIFNWEAARTDPAVRLAEKIWGNCELNPVTGIETRQERNMIVIPAAGDGRTEDGTLLSWLAINTGTRDNLRSCTTSLGCPSGQEHGNWCGPAIGAPAAMRCETWASPTLPLRTCDNINCRPNHSFNVVGTGTPLTGTPDQPNAGCGAASFSNCACDVLRSAPADSYPQNVINGNPCAGTLFPASGTPQVCAPRSTTTITLKISIDALND